ncbi:MAG: cold adaptation protein AtcA [Shewanella sp.]|uniref:cold adaptation protein AtcA n=1 Tax=Shewanella sp. SNU WT4 TaxID=2590015 RepID=UPI001127E56B|nr:hypothetical protein [Shewanella sp. SNU WT4]QDF67271.1 hypothetical protein FJQ87_11715 [Shewanella sp. SNU WT4]
MATTLNMARVNELKDNAYDNIESYSDPETPEALAQFSKQIKQILLADPAMLDSVPEYLPVALFNQVKFPAEAKLQWAYWIEHSILPTWDEFKTSIAFNNVDLPLVLAVKDYSVSLLVESCAVLYLLAHEPKVAAPAPVADDHDDDDDDYNERDEEGYYDFYDDEER